MMFDLFEIGNYKIIEIQISDTTILNNKRFKIAGSQLYVDKFNVIGEGSGNRLLIRFNKETAPGVPLEEGQIFKLKFNEFYLDSGSIAVLFGSNRTDTLRLVISEKAEYFKNVNENTGGKRFQDYVAGTNINPAGKMLGFYVTSFGNLITNDQNGNIGSFNNVPAGTFLPISPTLILNTSTVNGVIIYKNA